MAMRIELAGQVGLRGDGGKAPGDSLRRPAWVVLAYLAAERHRPVRRDEIAEVLWGEETPSSWDAIVRGLVSKLRAALSNAGAKDAITTAFGCYQLRLPLDAIIDVEEAADDVAVAESALAAGEPSRAAAAAARAAAVAARQFLPGAAGVWVERQQAELGELLLRALEALARAESASGNHAAAIQAAEELIVRAPLRESGHLRLITAQAAVGNRGEALRAYERCRRTLAEEVGVPPSPAIEATYLRLLQDDVVVVPRPLTVTSRPVPAALAVKDAPLFVGRQSEREQLDRVWRRVRAGERQAVFVGGEPGIGKTRVVAELALLAHSDGARVLYGRCDEELIAPYEPLADVVRDCLTLASPDDLVNRLHGHADELARLVPEFALALPGVPRPFPDDPKVARARLAEAVDALLLAIADVPIVVVLDDLHWAGEPALGVLRRLVRSPLQGPLMLIGTYRDTELGLSPALSNLLADTRRDHSVTRLPLAGITADDVAALVAVDVGEDLGTEGAAFAAALHAHTRGNPFFVGEVLRHLVTSTGLGPGRLPPAAELVTAVPEGVRETVTRRLLRLSALTNQLLAEAAVVGVEFDVSLLEELGSGRETVLDVLDEAMLAGLLVEVEAAGHYRFAHALIRHTIYDELGTVRRARIHRRVGQALEHLYGRQGRHIASLARHFCAGVPAADSAPAADYALAAARAAAEQLAYEEAAAHLRAGLAALDAGKSDPERRWRLLIASAVACSRVPDDPGRRFACQEAANLAREHGWSRRLAEAACLGATSHPYNWGDLAPVTLCREALNGVGDDEPGLRARLLCALVSADRLRTRGEMQGMVGLALRLARQSGDVDARGQALSSSCVSLKLSARRDDYKQLRENAEELLSLGPPRSSDADPLEWWLSLRRTTITRLGLFFQVDAAWALGEQKAVYSGIDELEHHGVARGDTRHLALAAIYRSLSALSEGRFEDVEARAEQARVAMERAMGVEAADLTRTHHLFRLRLEQGRLAEFEPELRTAVGKYPTCPTLRPMLALLCSETGRTDDARRDLHGLIEDPNAERGDWTMPVRLLFLADVSASLGEHTVASSLYDALHPHTGVFSFPAWALSHLGATDHFLAILATTLSRWDDADAHFEQALALEQAMGACALTARTLYWRARMLAERQAPGDVERARGMLGQVSASTSSLKMVRLDRQVQALATRL